MFDKDMLFQLLLNESCKILSLASDAIPVSKGSKKRWKDLATIWEANEAILGDVFQEVLYRIQNGKFRPNSMCRYNLKFSKLVEEAILCDEAFDAWKTLPVFRSAFQAVQEGLMRRLYKSFSKRIVAVTRYRYDRLLFMTYYRDPACAQVDLARAKRWEIKKARAAAIIRERYRCFKEAICVLLPEAADWSEQDWLRESHIMHSLARVHGIYMKDFCMLDEILDMLMKKLGRQSYCKELFALDDIPESIAACIWPEGVEKALGRQLCFFVQSMDWHVPSRKSQVAARAQRGWAYRKLLLAAASKSESMSQSVKQKLFDFGLGLTA